MIENDLQLKITQEQIKRLEKARQLAEEKPLDDPILDKAHRDGIDSLLSELRRQVRAYGSKNAESV